MEPPVERLLEASGGIPRRVHRAAERVGARARPQRRLAPPPVAPPPSARNCARPRTTWPATSSSCRPYRERAEHAADGTGTSSSARSRAWPPSSVDDAERVLRPRAARRRDGRAARRRAAAGHRRAVGQRQVVGAARRAARRARRRRAARQRALDARAAAPRRASAARARAGDSPARAARAGSSIAVDQFEELFTACRDEAERAAFVDALVAPRATRAGARSCWSPCAPTSTAAAPPTPSCRGCSAPTTCSSGRCAATSCAARSSCPRAAPACASSPSSSTR